MERLSKSRVRGKLRKFLENLEKEVGRENVAIFREDRCYLFLISDLQDRRRSLRHRLYHKHRDILDRVCVLFEGGVRG